MKFLFFDELDSTQKFAKIYCKKNNVKEPIAVCTEKQTNGTGRFNRKWFSPENKGLYVTYIIPEPEIKSAYQFKVSVAVSDFIENNFNKIVKLKWPNDLFYKNKKVGGILIDQIFNGNILKYILIGIGINFKNYTKQLPEDLKDIYQSLEIENYNLKNVVEQIFLFIQNKSSENIIDEYKQKSCIINKNVSLIDYDNKKYSGKVIDFSIDGKIIIYDNNFKYSFVNTKKLEF